MRETKEQILARLDRVWAERCSALQDATYWNDRYSEQKKKTELAMMFGIIMSALGVVVGYFL